MLRGLRGNPLQRREELRAGGARFPRQVPKGLNKRQGGRHCALWTVSPEGLPHHVLGKASQGCVRALLRSAAGFRRRLRVEGLPSAVGLPPGRSSRSRLGSVRSPG